MVPHCSNCGQALESDFGIVTCSHCGAQNILGFEKKELPDQDVSTYESPSVSGDTQSPFQLDSFDPSDEASFEPQSLGGDEASYNGDKSSYLLEQGEVPVSNDLLKEGSPQQQSEVTDLAFSGFTASPVSSPFNSEKEGGHDEPQEIFFLNQDADIDLNSKSHGEPFSHGDTRDNIFQGDGASQSFEPSDSIQSSVEESFQNEIESFVKVSPADMPRYPFGIKIFEVNLVEDRKKLEEALMTQGLLKSEFFPIPFLGEVNVFPLTPFQVVLLVRFLKKINFRYEVYEKRD